MTGAKKRGISLILVSVMALVLVMMPFMQNVSAAGNTATVKMRTYYNADVVAELVNYVNQVRYEACEAGVKLNDKVLTKDDYVPIKWSYDMEEIAAQRSLELGIKKSASRPNGESWSSALSSGGQYSLAECRDTSVQSCMAALENWYEEKAMAVYSGDPDTADYARMIDPALVYFGIAAASYTAAEYSTEAPTREGSYFDSASGYYTTDVEILIDEMNFEASYDSPLKVGTKGGISIFDKYVELVSVDYLSSDPDTVFVSAAGVTEGLKSGSAVISAYVKDSTGHPVIGADGKEIIVKAEIKVSGPSWKKDDHGWWYDNGDGTYPVDTRMLIDGRYYQFDEIGYMITGWAMYDGSWYFYDTSGAGVTGWYYENKTWYYLDPESGKMWTGWLFYDNNWYYMNADGTMRTGWLYTDSNWYFINDDGTMATGWVEIKNKWYFFNLVDGVMQTGWLLLDDEWYYLDGSGARLTGWQKIGEFWYYFIPEGQMTHHEWFGGYWFNADGSWTYPYIGSWEQDKTGWKFTAGKHWYAHNETLKINKAMYTFDKDGYWIETK